uniref:BCL2 like 14 n=1 Tax=Pelusios castaneus TaxID=367368 RepID=A0A8C8RFT0_9SAUR
MSSTNDANMEEISLEDEDRDNVEYKVLMAYAQRRLSASKYRELLKRESKTQKGPSKDREERKGIPQTAKAETHQGLSIQEKGPTAQCKKRKKKRFIWRCLLPSSCTRGEVEEGPQELSTNQDTINGYDLRMPAANEKVYTSTSGEEGDAENFLHLADGLATVVSARLHLAPQGAAFRALARTPSLEADDGQLKFDLQAGDEEKKIIETIVALLRQSGDKLEEKIKKDKTFYSSVTEMLSYDFFKKVTEQFLKEAPEDSTRETEGKIQCTKAAFVMEVTTRLTAVDNHPMNMIMGFGIKYLKENFSPWIQNHGGWENILNLLDQEEVE